MSYCFHHHHTMLAPALILLSLGAVGLCKVYDDVAELPELKFDYVIVGGGTAGNVVASRLTEDPKISVLLLEAGGSNEGVISSEVPFLFGDLFADSIYSWNYTSTPQPGLNGRSLGYFRAHFLGGCSAHNGMVYSRGAADNFNRYAQLTGDEGWSWDRLLPYFRKTEKLTDTHDTSGRINPRVHGTDGPISVSLSGFSWPEFSDHIIQTTKELPDDFPFNLDMNSGKPLGVGWTQSTIGGGERSTSATGYLTPKVMKRPNLHLLLNAQVSKLVNPSRKNGIPSFGGVQFRYGAALLVAKASKEIILSAGAVGTPQILMNSGIGSHATLSALGIPTVLDLPSVGRNASDHPSITLGWAVNSPETLETCTQNTTAFAEAMTEWETSRTGPFVDPGIATQIAWLRLKSDSPAFAKHPDPASGPDTPHIEFLLNPGGLPAPGPGNFMSIVVSVVSPASRGSVTITSNDPFAPPAIDLGALTNDFDILALKDGVGLAQHFISAPVWAGYLGAPTVDLTGDLEATIRSRATVSYHMVGTAGMSARGARYGVVDPDLRVKGMAGLSVIDASVLPFVPAAHTQAASYVIAERGADLVKQRQRNR
ncbi:pyranose dehydrogenase [Mycena capillaripes]|nr:pyranose dehydrogenase [Mycena capillaripes]